MTGLISLFNRIPLDLEEIKNPSNSWKNIYRKGVFIEKKNLYWERMCIGKRMSIKECVSGKECL